MERTNTKNLYDINNRARIVHNALMIGMELKYPVMEDVVWTVKMVEVSIDRTGLKERTCRMLMHKMIETNSENDTKKERWLRVGENMTYDMFLDWCNGFSDEELTTIAASIALTEHNQRNLKRRNE